MNTVQVPFNATATQSVVIERRGHAVADVSSLPYQVPTGVPLSIDAGQACYWSYAWRLGELESRAELAGGQGQTFRNAQEAIRWLLSTKD